MPLTRKPVSTTAEAPASHPAALDALENGSQEERWAAARAAVDMPDGARRVGEALPREENRQVREAMFTCLARIGSGESMDILIRFLRADTAHLRTGALDALIAMKTAAAPRLPGLLGDPDPDVRVLACDLARNIPGDETAALLCRLLDGEPEANVCAAAVDVLAELGGQDALPALARCADRFRATPFLVFSIDAAADSIRAQSPAPRA